MNILVTGANGQLGTALRRVSAASSDRYVFTDIEDLDITDPQAVEAAMQNYEIDLAVNCAAYTNVDAAESHPDTARLINADAPGYLARAAAARGAGIIHISTDYVFGGNRGNTPRGEEERANPTGVYGLTKLEGERQVSDSGAKAIIIRTAWLYSETGKNFLKTMLDLTGSKSELKVVFDQVGTPTYAGDLAEAIFNIIERRMLDGNEGIYHYSNEGVCSWYDFTKMIARLAAHEDCDIQPCHSDEFPSPVRRPSYSVLDKTKYKSTFGAKIPYWTDSLELCIRNLDKK